MVTKRASKARPKDVGVPWALRRTKQGNLKELIANFLRLDEENAYLHAEIEGLHGTIDSLEEQVELLQSGYLPPTIR